MNLKTEPKRSNALVVICLLVFTSCLFMSCGPKFQLVPLAPSDPPVTGSNGMVVAAHPMAAETGLRILEKGGNAIDAAIATLFMLNVVEPHASGLGGGGFALVRLADGTEKVVVYRERAAKSVNPDFYYDPADSLHERLRGSGSSVCVPAAAAGWSEIFATWGSKQFELKELAQDAIDAAENGFPVDPTLSSQIKNNFEKISADSLLSKTFLVDGLIPYEVGDTLRQPLLARTLHYLAERGLNSFYRGPLAEAVVNASRKDGGFLTLDDLEFYRVETVEPVKSDFEGSLAGYTALTIPPPSAGGVTLLETLHLFDLTGVSRYPAMSFESVHLMSQCQQQAYADADIRIGDPRVIGNGWRDMTRREFAQRAMTGIAVKPKPVGRTPVQAANTEDHGNTTHLVVVDQWGNVVCLTQSINWFFGSGRMAPNTGIILNNQMADFGAPDDSLNRLDSGRQPRSHMSPLILMKNDRPLLVVGTPGGSRIPAALAQIVANVVMYDQDISTAIDRPRFFSGGNVIVLENRFPMETVKQLKRKGYRINLNAGPYHVYFGGAHGIYIDPETGIMSGAADKRRGGVARGY